MKREEAIQILKEGKLFRMWDTQEQDEEALSMAIEALKADTVATIQTGQTYGKSAYIKELAEVVRCKDCRWWGGNKNTEHNNHICNRALNQGVDYWTRADDFCSYGERREP